MGRWVGEWMDTGDGGPTCAHLLAYLIITHQRTHSPTHLLTYPPTHLQLTHLIERLSIPGGFALLQVELGGLLKVAAGTGIIA